MNCKWSGSDQPRIVVGRHAEDCAGDCAGCLPCTLNHCLGCYRDHHDHVCPGCLADVRDTLTEIGRMVNALPAEVRAKGIDSEAMNLLGPAADAESLGHMQASVNVGRIPEDWLEIADNELHPLLVAGGWMSAYLEAFGHDEPQRITVTGALSYLARNLDHIGTEDDIPFRDFRRDLAACRAHMERVLHDGEQVETGAPCMTCRVPLRLVRTKGDDRWTCPRCRQESSDDQYRFAVKAQFIEESDELNADDMAVRTGLASSTIRRWANVLRVQATGEDAEELPALLEVARRVAGRKVYRVEDVEAIRSAGGDSRKADWLRRRAVLAETA